MAISKKEEKKEPASWKPVDIEKFNKNTETISEMFKSDPERLNKMKNQEGNTEK